MTKYFLPTSLPLRNPYSPFRNFNYLHIIQIRGADEDLRDYQVKIELNKNNFPLEKCKPDGSDIRFRDDNGQALPYWIESWTSEEAIVWCKIPFIPAKEEKIISIIYGNPAASSESNGNATFEFFDDFKPSNNFIFYGVFNDVHASDQCDHPAANRYCTEWNDKLDLVILKLNKILCRGLKFAISTGDFTDEEGCSGSCEETKDQAIATLQAEVQHLNRLQTKMYYCLGNHELYKLTKDEFMSYVGMEDKYYYVDLEDHFRIIVLDAQYDPSTNEDRGAEVYSVGHIPPQELDWLANDALNTARRCIVFCHQLLCAGGGFGSSYYVDNAADVRSILESAGNVIAVINSHVHENYFEIVNDIPYFVTEAHVDSSGLDKASYAEFWTFDNGAVGMLGDRGIDSRVFSLYSPSSKWTVDSGIWRVAGMLQGRVEASSGYAWIHSTQSFSNIVFRLKQQVSSEYTSFMWRFQDTNNYYYYHSVNDEIKKKVDGSATTVATLVPVDESIVHTFEVRLSGTYMEILVDGNSIGGASDSDLPVSGAIGFLTYRLDSVGKNGYGAQSEVYIRKLTASEPTLNI